MKCLPTFEGVSSPKHNVLRKCPWGVFTSDGSLVRWVCCAAAYPANQAALMVDDDECHRVAVNLYLSLITNSRVLNCYSRVRPWHGCRYSMACGENCFLGITRCTDDIVVKGAVIRCHPLAVEGRWPRVRIPDSALFCQRHACPRWFLPTLS